MSAKTKKPIHQQVEDALNTLEIHHKADKKKEAMEFALQMQEAKTQHELQQILSQIKEFDDTKTEQLAAESDLEKEISEGIEEREILEQLRPKDGSLGSVVYEASDQSQSLQGISNAKSTDIYEHTDIYKGDEYKANKTEQKKAHETVSERFDTRVVKSAVEEMIERTTNLYKRNQ